MVNKNVSRRVAVIGMTAAVYFILTMLLSFISYREVQFRLSEILNLLVFINPIFAPGIVLGCLLANLFSPFGMVDIIVGTLQSALVMLLLVRVKKRLWLAALWPVVGGLIIAAEIFFLSFSPPYSVVEYLMIAFSVCAGQAAVMFGAGYPLFRFVILKNEKLVRFLKEL